MARARLGTVLTGTVLTVGVVTALLAPASAAPLAPEQQGVRVTATRVGPYPGDVAATSSRTYVAIDEAIAVVNARSTSVSTRIPVKPFPQAVVLSADGTRLYVASGSTDWISIIDTTTNRVSGRFRSGGAPVAATISPDGTKLYVAAWDKSEIVVHTLPSGAILTRISVPGLADSLAVQPDGTKVLAMIDDPRFGIAVIDLATNSVRSTIDVGPSGQGWQTAIAISPDGRTAYAMANPSPPQPGFVGLVDLVAGRLTGSIPVGADLRDADLGPGGTRLYVTAGGSGPGGPTGSNGLVAVVDTASSRLIGTLSLDGAGRRGLGTQELAVSPDGSRVHASLTGPRGWLATAPLASVPATPSMPLSVRATRTRSTVTISWRPPETGNAAATEYVAVATPIVEGLSATSMFCRTEKLSCRISGLDLDLGYTILVQARNAAGWGPAAQGPNAGTSGPG